MSPSVVPGSSITKVGSVRSVAVWEGAHTGIKQRGSSITNVGFVRSVALYGIVWYGRGVRGADAGV